MHIIAGLVAIVGGIYFFIIRARNAAHMTSELMDVANDVRLAARRFGFTRRNNQHPVESLDDANVAIAGIATAFLELQGMPTTDMRDRLLVQLQSALKIDIKTAEETTLLGRWLMTECASPSAAIDRLSRRLFKLTGNQNANMLVEILKYAVDPETGLSNQQTEAIQDIKRALKL